MDVSVVFIAYASADGFDFAAKLAKWLDEFDPPVKAWMGHDNPQDASFDQRIENAILGSQVMMLVLTPAAVADGSWVRRELLWAQSWKKPILTVRPSDSTARPPLAASGGAFVDMHPFKESWNQLAHTLRLLLPTDETIIELTALHREAERQASMARDDEQVVLRGRAGVISAVIQHERRRRSDPELAQRRVRELIDDGQREDAAGQAGGVPEGTFRIIDGPPTISKGRPYDRDAERNMLVAHLSGDKVRILTLCGPSGAGKTTLVGDLIARLPQLGYVGATYVSTHAPNRVTPDLLLEKLVRAHPDRDESAVLLEHLTDRSYSWRQKLNAAIERFGERSVLIIIDNAEELLDQGQLSDPHLREFAHAIKYFSGHGLRLLLVSQVEGPKAVDDRDPTDQVEIPPHLPRRFADDFVRGLDVGNAVGLERAGDETMRRIYQLADGHPRQLELLYAVLRSQRTPDLDELLKVAAAARARGVCCALHLIRQIITELNVPTRRVLQALAVYGRPVRSSAVSWLLVQYVAGFDSTAALNLLCDQRIVRRDGDLFYLPAELENRIVLETIPDGQSGEQARGQQEFNRHAMWRHAAEYFHDVQGLEFGVREIGDLAPYFSEIDLRLAGGEYPEAANLVDKIDCDHLKRWGYRSLVVRHRERLVGRLDLDDAAEIGNRYELATIYLEASRPEEAARSLTQALELAHAIRPGGDSALRLELAKAYYSSGKLSIAVDEYRETLRRCRPSALATGRIGLAVCLSELGQIEEALDQYSAALEVVQDWSDEAFAYLNLGVAYQDLGRPLTALASIGQARRRAHEHSDELLVASCDDAAAYVLIDTGRLGRSRRLAESAIRVATDAYDVELAREAYFSLALARLLAGDASDARDAADAAARFFDNQRPVAPLALLGITQLRLNDRPAAERSFSRVLRETDRLLAVEPHAVQVLDIRGLALVGRELCDPVGEWDPARDAYRRARDRTRAPGVVLRAVRLLEELLDGDRSPGAMTVLDAACGN